MSRRSLPDRLLYDFLRFVLKIIAVLFFRVRYFGLNNIPAKGGVLVVCNHQSLFDPPFVGVACPRHMNYLARDSLFRFPIFSWIIRTVNAIPIDREGFGLAGVKESLKRLKQGEMIVVFPEGTRTPDGEIKPFRPGFTSLAVRSSAAILPVAIEGAYHCWPRSHKFPRPGVVYVCYGQPILTQQFASMDERDLIKLVEQRVRQCHAHLLRMPIFSAKTTSPSGRGIV
ncbi:MAG TPA: lysophospholipid acyltransferase family protein [Thermoguttaceae bacterium]